MIKLVNEHYHTWNVIEQTKVLIAPGILVRAFENGELGVTNEGEEEIIIPSVGLERLMILKIFQLEADNIKANQLLTKLNKEKK